MNLIKLIITLSLLSIPVQTIALDFSKMNNFEKVSLYIEIMRVYSMSKTAQPVIAQCEKQTENGAEVRKKFNEFSRRHSKLIELGRLISDNPNQHTWLTEKMKKNATNMNESIRKKIAEHNKTYSSSEKKDVEVLEKLCDDLTMYFST